MQKKSAWPRVRKFFNDVHLWLGLSSGLIVVAVCFSGTVYVWNTELTERSASHLYKVKHEAGQQRIPVDSLFGKIMEVSGGDITTVSVPAAANRTYQFSTRKKGDQSRGGVAWFVNPYTGEIAGNSKEKNGTKEFMSTMFSLHRWLLLDKIETPIIKGVPNRELGSMITGWATIIFTLGCITGLIIWFPQKIKAWKQGLKIRFSANWKRVNHDLHNTLAFYALFFLLLMGLTGPQWSFSWYRTGLQKTLGTYKPAIQEKEKPKKDTTAELTALLPINSYLNSADKVLDYPGDYTVGLPSEASASITISKYKTGFFAPSAADRLTLDAGTAAIKKKDIFKDKPFNERIAGSIKAIHVGNVYGTFTKIIYFLACLIATTLPITGTLIWWNKLKKKRKRKPIQKSMPVQHTAVNQEQVFAGK
jgi:uncharacterized iron-regulated membrane protein